MIYLIGGPSRCGKTLLTKRVYPRAKAGFISTDQLKRFVLHSMPKNDVPKKFPLMTMRPGDGRHTAEMFGARAIIKAVEKEAQTLWPPLREFIEQLIGRDEDYVIEGIHLLPKLVSELRRTAHWRSLRIVYVVKTDVEAIKQGFVKNKTGDDRGKVRDASALDSNARFVAEYGRYCVAEAKKHHLKHFDVGNQFIKKLAQAQAYLLQER